MSSHITQDPYEVIRQKLEVFKRGQAQHSLEYETLSAKERLEEIIKRIDIWNGGSSSRTELGRNKLRKLIGWKDSDETSFGYKLLEEIIAAYSGLDKEVSEEDQPQTKLPSANDLAYHIRTQLRKGEASVNEVCKTIINISSRLGWNYADPWIDSEKRMSTPPEHVLDFLESRNNSDKIFWYGDLNKKQQDLLLIIGEAFMRWYRLSETQDMIEELNND